MIAILKKSQPAFKLKRGQELEVIKAKYDEVFKCDMYLIKTVIYDKEDEEVNPYESIEGRQLLPISDLKIS